MDDIQVIDVDPVTRRVIFGIKPKKIKGISKLVQIVIISLLNVPGRDVLFPSKGGGLPAMLGSNVDPNDSTDLYAEVSRRVKKTESEIIADQIGLDDTPEEKLSKLQIVNVSVGVNADAIDLTLRIINQAGQATDVTI